MLVSIASLFCLWVSSFQIIELERRKGTYNQLRNKAPRRITLRTPSSIAHFTWLQDDSGSGGAGRRSRGFIFLVVVWGLGLRQDRSRRRETDHDEKDLQQGQQREGVE